MKNDHNIRSAGFQKRIIKFKHVYEVTYVWHKYKGAMILPRHMNVKDIDKFLWLVLPQSEQRWGRSMSPMIFGTRWHVGGKIEVWPKTSEHFVRSQRCR